MDDILISRAAASDQPQLHKHWQTVFGDPTELILAFFDCFPPEISAWTVRCGDEIFSAAYLIPGNWFMNGTQLRPAGYVYAVATPENHRGHGYAGRLMHTIAAEANERELLLYTRPAEASLFPWYAKTMSAGSAGHMREIVVRKDPSAACLPCRKLTYEEYGIARERLLRDVPHIVCSERFLRLQNRYSEGFFAVSNVLCCCTMQEQRLLISECLGPEESFALTAQTMMEYLGPDSAVIRTETPDGALPSAAYCASDLPDNTHWGLFLE